MKTVMTPIRMFRLTIQQRNRDGSVSDCSKRVTTARQAAEFYTLTKGSEWWCLRGHLCGIMPNNQQGLPDRYQRWQQRDTKLMRRVLPIFQKVLP